MNDGLKSDREYRNKLEYHFLEHIGHEHVENLTVEIEAEREQWEKIQLPDSLNQWFTEFNKQQDINAKKIITRKRTLSFLKKAAVVLLFIVGFNYILIVNVDAYRFRILDSIFYFQNKFIKIETEQDESKIKTNIPKDWDEWYYLTYWPSGYTLISSRNETAWATLTFQNEEGYYITLQQAMRSSSQQLDSEDGDIVQFEINGEKALFTEKDGLKILSWIQEDRAIYLEADGVDTKEMIKIAENLEKN